MQIVVLGGGVIGCTSALILAEQGHAVTLVARDLPSDSQSQSFASPWAGANWHSFPGSSKQIQAWERITYAKLKSMIPSGLVGELKWRDYWLDDTDTRYIETAWYNDLIPDHRLMTKEEVPEPYKAGASLTTLSLAPSIYLPWLESQLIRLGVKIIRRKVESLEEASTLASGARDAALVVNATGLGAASLVGCMDEAVMPARGQTVLVHAPWLEGGIGVHGFDDGTFSYIIPRPDGNAVVGGTMDQGSWDTSVDPATANRLLRNAYKICPELSHHQGWEAIQVISHNVGLRPSRRGGPRCELEVLKLPLEDPLRPKWGRGASRMEEGKKRELGVVHAYGIGPAGYQSSWGLAANVAELVDEYSRTIPSASARRESKL